MVATDDVVGSGEAAAEGMLLTVDYRGTLDSTGAQFDASKVHPRLSGHVV